MLFCCYYVVLLFVLLCYYLCCPMYWLCVLYHCHRVLTQLQLTNISISIRFFKSISSQCLSRNTIILVQCLPVPVSAWSKASVYRRSLAGILRSCAKTSERPSKYGGILRNMGSKAVAYRGGVWGIQPPPPPKFRRYRWRPRSHKQEEPASRFPFVVHCVLIRL